jgi:hypothetical protein
MKSAVFWDVSTRSIEIHDCSDEHTASIVRVEDKAEQVASKNNWQAKFTLQS